MCYKNKKKDQNPLSDELIHHITSLKVNYPFSLSYETSVSDIMMRISHNNSYIIDPFLISHYNVNTSQDITSGSESIMSP